MNASLDLTHTGLTELDDSELQLDGGGFPFGAAAVLYVIVTEWEEIKRASVDAWRGTYDPPSLRN